MYETYLYRRTWTIIHFIELQDLFKQGSTLDSKIREIKYLCSKQPNCTQANAISLLEKRLKSPNQLQSDLFDVSLRKKRGVFNIVGEVHKILWGTLAASDIDYINNEIDKLYKQNNNVISIVTQDTLQLIAIQISIFIIKT